MPVALTVCLLTFNSERLLEACVQALLPLADEWVVVDSGSTDGTLDILRRFGITPVQRAYKSHSDQMNFAASLATHDWVLCMDSDEIIDEATRQGVQALKDGGLADPTRAWRISRHWVVLGQEVHAIYPVSSPDYPVRMFHRRHARFNDAPVDDKVEGFASTEVIRGRVHHDTFYSVHEVFQKVNTYTTRAVKYRQFSPSLAKALLSPWAALGKWYLLKGGWKDGRVGVVGGAYAFLYTFLKYFKAWYAMREAKAGEGLHRSPLR